MSQEFRRVTLDDLNEQLRVVVEERLMAVVTVKQPGHCMKVSDLDKGVMESVARSLRATLGSAVQVHVLSGDMRNDDPLFISSSKLVELRNPPAQDEQRAPLLVFVPNDLRTAAEDSFAEATFEQVSISDAYDRLRERLVQDLPNGLKQNVPPVISQIESRHWRWATPVAAVRFLLSIRLNSYDHEVVGASLCEFGLVPDFRLMDDAAAVPERIAKNISCVKTLTLSPKSDQGRVLDLKLRDREFRAKLSEFLCSNGLEDPQSWTSRIVCEKERWGLSFDKWPFDEDAGFAQKLRVEVLKISLPEIKGDETDSRLGGLQIGQQYLVVGKGGINSFRINFRCSPAPEEALGIDHFRVQIVQRETGPVGPVKKKKSWGGARTDTSLTFSSLSKIDWEEGWHFIRVAPYTADGDPLPMVDANGNAIPTLAASEEGPFPNESDLFWVVKGDDLDVEIPQRAVQKFPSFSHALIHFWFKALNEGRGPQTVECVHRAWADAEHHGGKGELLELKFSGEGLIHVPVSRKLKEIEQRILNAADDPVSWRLAISPTQGAEVSSDALTWPDLPDINAFRTARVQLFTKLRGDDGNWIMQAVNLVSLREEIASYAERYLALLAHALRHFETAAPDAQPQALSGVQRLLALDTVTLNLADHRGTQRAALLVGPTHPLRLLWLATWLSLAEQWVKQAEVAAKEYVTPTRDALLEQLSLVNFPAMCPTRTGQLLAAIDNVHELWTVYASSTENDPRGLVAEVCTALGLPEPNVGSFTLDGRFLADRLRRYLVQHPYIQTLVLNCFNPGRARIIEDMLLELQKEPDFCDLRYDIRLFVPDPDAVGVGDDLNELISPSSALTVPEADAFATPTGNHLAPKLTFSVRATADFRNAASEFPAHITMLFDVFPAQTVCAMAPRREDMSSPVHGLLQDFTVTYSEEADLVAWHRRPRHGAATPIPNADEYSTLIAQLAESFSTAAAAVATNQSGLVMRPVSTLVLEAEQKALLHQVHEVSDWVFTIDRSLGIEFFDHDRSTPRPEYLIDHSPDLSANSGRRVVITSRSQTEIRVLFERVLADYGLGEYQDRSHAILGELRALSGRLALKLISSPTQRAEALGLALGKLFLEFQNAFRDQAVIPLDAHLGLYRALQKNADEFGDEVSLRRTDLALFDFQIDDNGNIILTCSLVEVKCYKDVGNISGLNHLKHTIAEQIQQSENALRHHFDPERSGRIDRPDRVIKTQELINLLEFYVDRAARLRLLSPEASEEAKFCLRSMESGYRLRFTRSAIVFDFQKRGRQEFIEDDGIEFHWIGVDLIRSLLAALPAKDGVDETGAFQPVSKPTSTTSPIPLLEGQIPRLERAAFLREKRDRTVTWEKLGLHTEPTRGPEAVPGPRAPVVPPNPRLEPVGEPPKSSLPSSEEPPVAVPPATVVAPEPLGRGSHQHAAHDILLGVTGPSPQFGVLGKVAGRAVALDLNQTHTISLFGVQGGGKSYTLGTIIEMASLALPGINELPSPLATVVFHYSQTQDYKPEFTSMNRPNSDKTAIDSLAAEFNAGPAALKDMVLLVPEAKLDARRAEYPNVEVVPLKFASSELQAGHWRFLMGAIGNQATYIRKLNQIMRGMRDGLTLSGLREAVATASLPDNLKELASLRLDLAESYIDDAARLSKVIRPGRLVIVDLRDEFIEKDEALGLFVVLLQLFADATFDGKPFNKLVVFDEAHKYIDSPDLVAGLVSVVREMRHKGTSILVASQDPPSVPVSLIELSTQIILHRFNSPAWLKHIQKANAALLNLTAEQLARLQPGEAFVWSSKATDATFSREAVKVRCRLRATLHGGDTKTAV